jgi:hypothetical protein
MSGCRPPPGGRSRPKALEAAGNANFGCMFSIV